MVQVQVGRVQVTASLEEEPEHAPADRVQVIGRRAAAQAEADRGHEVARAEQMLRDQIAKRPPCGSQRRGHRRHRRARLPPAVSHDRSREVATIQEREERGEGLALGVLVRREEAEEAGEQRDLLSRSGSSNCSSTRCVTPSEVGSSSPQQVRRKVRKRRRKTIDVGGARFDTLVHNEIYWSEM